MPPAGTAFDRVQRTAARGVRLPYVPALDGLRALAVLSVLLYHAGVSWLPGGFLGVECFFVISGYLITALLLGEWQQRGTVDLRAFWSRRARRLLPALYTLLLLTLFVAGVVIPNQLSQLRGDALAAFGYVTNWYLIFHHQSYFVAIGRPSLLQHLWSLAVEEQFYLLWPVLFWIGVRCFGRWFGVLALVGALLSATEMAVLFRPGVDPSRLYYGTDTRSSGLLLGAALAFCWSAARPPALPRRLALVLPDALGAGALALLGVCCWRLGEYSSALYRGGFLLVGVLTCVLIAVTVHPAARGIRWLLGSVPMRWLGLRSYGIYLWHWPVFMLTRPGVDVPLSGAPLLGLRLGATLVLAALSYRFVERPLRGDGLARAWRVLRSGTASGLHGRRLGWVASSGFLAGSAGVVFVAVAMARPPEAPVGVPAEALHISLVAPLPAAAAVASTPTVTPVPQADAAAETSGATPPAEVSSVSASTAASASFSASTNIAALVQPEVSAAFAAASEPALAEAAVPQPLPLSAIRVVAVGDSVMLGAAPALRDALPAVEIDAQVSRQIAGVISVLRALGGAGRLSEVVVVQIGNNGPITATQFDDLMQALAGVRHVIVVNAKVPLNWEGPNDDLLATAVKKYPNAELADWRQASSGHPEYFVDDGVHLMPVGARAYSRLIADDVSALGIAAVQN